MSTLAAQSLAKKYKRRSVVKDVSFHINSGEVVGLLGPNAQEKPLPFIWSLAWLMLKKATFTWMIMI